MALEEGLTDCSTGFIVKLYCICEICLSTFTVHFSMAGMAGRARVEEEAEEDGGVNDGPLGLDVQGPFHVALYPAMMTDLAVVLGRGNSLLGPADCSRDSSEMNDSSFNRKSLIWDMMEP